MTQQDLARSASIMRRRLEKLGVRSFRVRVDGPDEIAIELPKRAAANVRFASKTALLEFYDFEASLTGRSVVGGSPIARPTVAALLGDKHSVPAGTVVVRCETVEENCLSVQQVTTKSAFYLFKNKPALSSADIDLSRTRADLDPQTSRVVMVIQFTDRGKRIFGEITRREARRGAARCAGKGDQQAVLRCAQHFAIVLDHKMVSVPYIDFARNPDGIPGDNGAQIDIGGVGSLAAAKKLALAVQTGALPVQFVSRR